MRMRLRRPSRLPQPFRDKSPTTEEDPVTQPRALPSLVCCCSVVDASHTQPRAALSRDKRRQLTWAGANGRRRRRKRRRLGTSGWREG
eukprot:3619853-Rhodomonas_salina.1